MTDADLEYAELQFVWEKEVGDFNDDEMARALDLVKRYGVKVPCITRHDFVGLLVGEVEVDARSINATWLLCNAASIWRRPLIQNSFES